MSVGREDEPRGYPAVVQNPDGSVLFTGRAIRQGDGKPWQFVPDEETLEAAYLRRAIRREKPLDEPDIDSSDRELNPSVVLRVAEDELHAAERALVAACMEWAGSIPQGILRAIADVAARRRHVDHARAYREATRAGLSRQEWES